MFSGFFLPACLPPSLPFSSLGIFSSFLSAVSGRYLLGLALCAVTFVEADTQLWHRKVVHCWGILFSGFFSIFVYAAFV